MRINSSFISQIIFAVAKTFVCLGAITVINPIATATGLQSAPLPRRARPAGRRPSGSAGIDPAITIDLEIKDMRALEVLEIVLRQASDVSQNDCRWQTTPSGIEVGPKSRLLRPSAMERRVYMVADLGFKVADFQPPPLQSGGTGGGTAPPPLTPSQQDARYQKLKSLIQATVETDVWAEPSGGPCTIAIFNNTMIVIAPDFVHRSIAGNSLVRATTSPISQPTH